jgi:hypothetical protein
MKSRPDVVAVFGPHLLERFDYRFIDFAKIGRRGQGNLAQLDITLSLPPQPSDVRVGVLRWIIVQKDNPVISGFSNSRADWTGTDFALACRRIEACFTDPGQ